MRISVALLSILLTGCITTRLSPEGAQVRVTANPNAVEGCELLGEVSGGDRLNGGALGAGAAEKNARAKMQNRAAEMGANVVLISGSSSGIGGASMFGEAYACDAG